MKKTGAIILTSLAVCCIVTFECFAPHNKGKRVASSTQQTPPDQQQAPQAQPPQAQQPAPQPQQLAPQPQPPVQPIALRETEAFKYLHGSLPDSRASWLAWSKRGTILNLLRQKQLQAAIADPAQRTRTEHDLDWAIRECMNPAYNSDLAEMFVGCAEQDVKVNESSLQIAHQYTRQELAREFAALKKIQDEAFARIKKMKALERLVKRMQTSTIQDDESDVEDYDEQHMFDKTRAAVMQVQTAAAAAAAAAPAPAPATVTAVAIVPVTPEPPAQ